MPSCLLATDPYGSLGRATAAEFIHHLEADAERQLLEGGFKVDWQTALSLGRFLEEETDNDETSSSQWTEDRSRSTSPCPTLSTSGDSCADSDFSSDEGTKAASNRRGVQNKASTPQYSRSSGSTPGNKDDKARSGEEAGRDDHGRDDSSSEMTLDLDMRFKKSDEAICYACPFRKRNPIKCNFRNYYECATSFPDLERVREHLGRCHLQLANETSNNEDTTPRRSVYTSDPALWMTSETFDSIKIQGDESSNPRQKWEYIWRCLFGHSDHVLEPDFEAPIEAEELVSELQRSLHLFDAQVRREVESLAAIPSTSSALASLGARITELWVQYLNSTFERCERKVRGSSSIRLALPRRATTDVVSYRPLQSGSEALSSGLTPRAKTFDCFRTTVPSTLEIMCPGLDSFISNLPSFVASGSSLEHNEASPTPTLSGSSTILNGSFHEEPVTTLSDDQATHQDVVQSCQDLDDADTSDSSSCSNEEEQDDDGEDAEDDAINEMISRVSSIILGVLTPNPSDSLIQAVQSAVENFVIELFNDVLFMGCPHDGESASGSNSKPNGSSGSLKVTNTNSSSSGAGKNGKGILNGDPKEDGSEQGDRLPGPDNAVNHDGCPSRLCCPFRIRNPVKFNSRDFPVCANKQWVSMYLLKRHIRSVHRRKDEMEYKCLRCKQGFPTSDRLHQHCEEENGCQSVKSAGSKVENPEDGLSAEGLKRLDNRKAQDKIQSWQALWRLLFPGDADVPLCVMPNEIEGLTQSFQESQPNLDEAIGNTISQFVPEDVVQDLANQLSTLFQHHVTDTLRHHGVILGGSRAASKAASSRNKSTSPSSPASSSDEADPAPVNKKRKSRHAGTEVLSDSAAQTSTSMAYQPPLASAPDPDLTDWTLLSSRLPDQSIASPGSHYSVGQPSFQNGSNYVPLSMMMNSPGYQTVPPTPASSYAIPQGYGHTSQSIVGVMNSNLNASNGMAMNFCPSCGGQWPCPAHCMRPN